MNVEEFIRRNPESEGFIRAREQEAHRHLARDECAGNRVILALIVGLAIALVYLAWTWPALAHDALPTAAQPQGWKYPFSCCSGYDCREVADAKIGERPEGYVIKATGEVLAYSDARIKESPDGRFHWCSVAGADDSRTICLFVPPRSY